MNKPTNKLRLALVATMLTCAASVWASPISESQALSAASRFMAGKSLTPVALQHAHRAPGQSAGQAYYVFNAQAHAGYVIVAGDDRVPPVLGYSDSGTFDPADVPPAMQALLDGYAEQIAALPADAQASARVSRNAIAPLLTCIWGQGEPFNYYLPFTRTATSSGVTRAYHGKVGCVATAMAQVMYYHKWPTQTDLPIPAYVTKTNGYQMPELPVTTFNWQAMKNAYNSTDSLNEAGQAAALLSLYCSQSLQTDLLKSTSSASTSSVGTALVNYFNYAATARYVKRENYNTQTWENMLYAELQASRPVVYRGDKNPGGHAFVVDGCDNTGLFHINWGWNGLSNGYFVLSELNPDAQGIGGAEGECGYIFGQAMVIGIKPNDYSLAPINVRFYTMVVNSLGNSRASSSDNFTANITGRFLNNTSEEEVFDYGWGIFSGDEMLSVIDSKSRSNGLAPNYYLNSTFDLAFGAGLSNGTYYLRPIFADLFDTNWQVCEGGLANYVEVNISGNSCTYEVFSTDGTPQYKANDMTFAGTMHTHKQVTATASITNLGNTMGNMIYILDNGTKANVSLVDLEKSQTGNVVFYFTPAVAGEHTITLSLNEDGSNPLIIKQLTITDMPEANLTMSNKILYVTDAANKIITSRTYSVETTITNSGTNAYDEEVVLRLYRVYNGTSGTNVQDVAMPLQLAPGETKVVRFDCDNVVSGERYFAWVYYFSAGEQVKCKGTSSHTLIFPTEPEYQRGDVNGDGTVDITDVNMIVNVMLGKTTASSCKGDPNVDGQGGIDIADVNAVINLMLGK